MPERRIHRKELKKKLKQDEVGLFVADLRASVAGYLGRYGRLTFWTVMGIVLVLGCIILWRWKRTADFTSAQGIYAAAIEQMSYRQPDFGAAQNTLTELIERFGGEKCSPAALVLRAYCRHKQKLYADALNDYRDALESVTDQATRHSIRISIVQCYRSLGRTQDAVAELESLRTEAPAGVMRDQVIYLLARCREDLNQPDQALALYNELGDDSPFKQIARDRISWLETQPVPPLNPVG